MMKGALRCLTVMAFCASAACTPVLPGPIESIVNQPVAGNVQIDERLMYAAEAAYNIPAHAYVSAHSRGLITDALRARIRPILQNMYATLQAARAAYRLGDAAAFNEKRAALAALRAQVEPLIPR